MYLQVEFYAPRIPDSRINDHAAYKQSENGLDEQRQLAFRLLVL